MLEEKHLYQEVKKVQPFEYWQLTSFFCSYCWEQETLEVHQFFHLLSEKLKDDMQDLILLEFEILGISAVLTLVHNTRVTKLFDQAFFALSKSLLAFTK